MSHGDSIEDADLGAALGDSIGRLDAQAPIPSSGKQTANAACRLLVAKRLGFVVPTGPQRQNIVVAFAKAGAVVYGKAFDVVRQSASVNLDDESEVSRRLSELTLYEVKSTNRKVSVDFGGYFFSLSTAELLVAQSLREQFRFAFVNVTTGDFMDLSLVEVFARAKGIYPTWSIRF
jgi:hypothetical protein